MDRRQEKVRQPTYRGLLKNRMIVLGRARYCCEICGAGPTLVHHKDCKRHDHSIENLMVVCRSCHTDLHRSTTGRPRTLEQKIALWGKAKFVFDLNPTEGEEFEKELNRLKIGKIDLFRLSWTAYKESQKCQVQEK